MDVQRTASREVVTRGGLACSVLCCEADAITARLMARHLQGLGCTPTICGEAAACDAALAVSVPDLLVLAILLPDIDGLAYTRRLRQRGVQVPILVVSALHAEQRAREAGADAFLLKPVQAPVLAATVHRLIAGTEVA